MRANTLEDWRTCIILSNHVKSLLDTSNNEEALLDTPNNEEALLYTPNNEYASLGQNHYEMLCNNNYILSSCDAYNHPERILTIK